MNIAAIGRHPKSGSDLRLDGIEVTPLVSRESQELLAGEISADEYFERTGESEDLANAYRELARSSAQVTRASLALMALAVLAYIVGALVSIVEGQATDGLVALLLGGTMAAFFATVILKRKVNHYR